MPFVIPLYLAFIAALSAGQEVSPPGYAWHDLGEGVYVHARTDPLAGPVDGSSVVIVNDEDVVVVDTHIDPAAARAVVGRIRDLTDNPVSVVVNTHWHDDHTNGNYVFREAFPDARFVAHPATMRALEAGWQEMEDQRRATYASVRGRDLAGAAQALEASDPQRAIGVRLFAGYRDALESELPDLELVYPDQAVDSALTLERGARRILIESVGPANTEGDLVVWLPREAILITGDILVAPVPFAFDAPMLDWVEALGRVDAYEARTIVPGHGGVLHDGAYTRQVRSLLAATLDAVRDARSRGIEYAELEQSVDLEAFERLFTQGDPERVYAWRSYFFSPGLQSAWKSLGYPIPQGDSPS